MRNLKRALSLALAMVMVLSMMVIGAGAANYDDFSDKDEIVNTEAVSVLVELGVIAGKDDGSYDPTGIVTRAEMAKMICVVLNGGKDPSLGSTVTNSYTDTVGHWAAGYIEYCTQLGIVAGKGDGTFAPNDTVTATEAAKMLLVALGYAADNIVDGSKDDIEDALDAAGEDGVVEVSGELPATITVPADRTLVLTGNVEGTATIDGDGTVELNGATVIDGNVTLTGKVDVTDTVTVNGTLDLTNADVVDVKTLVLDVAADATVVNAAWDSSDFTESAFVVAGNAAGGIDVTFGDAALTGDLSINEKDTLVVEGTLEVGENELRVTGSITVKGTLDLTGSTKVIAPEAITFEKGATLIVDAAWTELSDITDIVTTTSTYHAVGISGFLGPIIHLGVPDDHHNGLIVGVIGHPADVVVLAGAGAQLAGGIVQIVAVIH